MKHHHLIQAPTIGSRVLIAAAAALLFCFLGTAAHAQVLYGSITGNVTDATGAAVPGATVKVINKGTGVVTAATTNGQGMYTISDLQQGIYRVDVTTTLHLSPYTVEAVPLSVNQVLRINAQLKTGGVEEAVTVTAEAPALQTDSAQVSHEISQTQLANLPITSSEGRNFQALYALIPGVTPPAEQNSAASNPARAEAVNVNGVANVSNTTRIDGAVNYYGWLPYIVAYVPPADSIQNVNIVTNSFNAEQGTAGGSSINVIIKSGTNKFHGSLWEYNEITNLQARPFFTTKMIKPIIPKNIFNQFGFSIGGPIIKDKLFFFGDFERTTRRQSISGTQTVPTTALAAGDFSATGITLYDPTALNPNGSRMSFLQETGKNAIPAGRINQASAKMLALLAPISQTVTSPNYTNNLANDYFGSATAGYNREAIDVKINYNPTEKTTFFGRYSISPDSLTDPQELGAAGGGTFDGGQPGAATGRIQNIGLGATHTWTPNLLIDANFGYTRQRTGAQANDISLGQYGLNTLGIPGTNGNTTLTGGIPAFAFSNGFSTLGNSNGSSPFLFRDNQYTGNVNLTWVKGKHNMRYGGEYTHFALNHFQPTNGGGTPGLSPRGGFLFSGGLTTQIGTPATGPYYSLADFLLGLPTTVNKATAGILTNALRWSTFAFYAQDQWNISPKLTLSYGIRYEYYPFAVRDHSGVFRFDPSLPQTANVVIGGVGGVPNNTGENVGKGLVVPRIGINYRPTDKTVLRTGFGITEDPDNFRTLRDTYPADIQQNYTGIDIYHQAIDPANSNAPVNLVTGIPPAVLPDYSSGHIALPVSLTTNTVPKDFRRGYIESWNLFVQQDLGEGFVSNIGYVGTHEVRQITNVNINAAPIPSASNSLTPCNPTSAADPQSPYHNCNYAGNRELNLLHNCPPTNPVCYNSTDINSAAPTFSSEYSGLQAQLSRRFSSGLQFGIAYTWSKAIDFSDNSNYSGLTFAYPAYWSLNRSVAGYDRTNNLQVWAVYRLPFGRGQAFASHGLASVIFGGFQLNARLARVSGTPMTLSATNALNAGGNSQVPDVVVGVNPIVHPAHTSLVNGGTALQYINPAAFTAPPSTRFGTAGRNDIRGPGYFDLDASLFREFHIYKETNFQFRFETFDTLNNPQFQNPSLTQSSTSAFGTITNTNANRNVQLSGRINF